ncbi:MAG: T9SS type A sorting domain-containing protein [Candidatus Krumholzibacteriota bacterium]|nr:T9SS type A sorting domain-containing protein [Candidatus Krumholzibacteriota bacterium]
MRLFVLLLFIPSAALAAVGFGDSAPGTMDTAPPAITLISPQAGEIFGFPVEFVWTIDEDSPSSAYNAVVLSIIAPPDEVIMTQNLPMEPTGEYSYTWTVPTTIPIGTFWLVAATDAFGNHAVAGIDSFTTTGAPDPLPVSASLTLWDAWPNPFNPRTTFRFSLPTAGKVKLAVYDPAGRLVATLHDGHLERGWHEIAWHAGSQASGVYLVRLSSEAETRGTKIVLLK